MPQDSRDAFELLANAGKLEPALAASLKGMVGFRNVAVHDYTRLDLAIVQSIIERRLGDLQRFASETLRSA